MQPLPLRFQACAPVAAVFCRGPGIWARCAGSWFLTLEPHNNNKKVTQAQFMKIGRNWVKLVSIKYPIPKYQIHPNTTVFFSNVLASDGVQTWWNLAGHGPVQDASGSWHTCWPSGCALGWCYCVEKVKRTICLKTLNCGTLDVLHHFFLPVLNWQPKPKSVQ